MKALVASTSGALDAQSAAQQKLPVVLIQGGLHAGEINGKDAGFLALRELLDGKAGKGVLDKLVWVFVPVFNVDGHERCGACNRPNQRGTEQMGWRTTAQNFNLNRDDVKADAPEMQAMLQLVQQWDPLMYVDLHVTDGAKFEHDVSVQVEPAHAGDATLQRDGTRWRDAVLADLKNRARCRCRITRRSCTKTTLAPALHTMYRRRVFRTTIFCCATAPACWWKRIRGRITPRACESPAMPSSRCCSRLHATARSGAPTQWLPINAPRIWLARPSR